MGFSVPLADWLKDDLRTIVEATLFASQDGISSYFKMDAIRTLWEDHLLGRKDNSTILWSLLMFQMWWNNYISEETDKA